MLIKDINFFDRYKEAERLEKNVSKATIVKTFVVVGIIAVTFITTSVLQVFKLELQSEINRINTYVSSEEVTRQLAEIEAQKIQLDGATKYYNGIVAANNNIETHIQPEKELLDSIWALLPQGTVTKDFDYRNGAINLLLTADNEDKLAQFINNLWSNKNVYALGYNGFKANTETQYESTVTINLTPGGEGDE